MNHDKITVEFWENTLNITTFQITREQRSIFDYCKPKKPKFVKRRKKNSSKLSSSFANFFVKFWNFHRRTVIPSFAENIKLHGFPKLSISFGNFRSTPSPNIKNVKKSINLTAKFLRKVKRNHHLIQRPRLCSNKFVCSAFIFNYPFST